jgi:hypothetical protein
MSFKKSPNFILSNIDILYKVSNYGRDGCSLSVLYFITNTEYTMYRVAQKSLDTADFRPICTVVYILQYLSNQARK